MATTNKWRREAKKMNSYELRAVVSAITLLLAWPMFQKQAIGFSLKCLRLIMAEELDLKLKAESKGGV